MNDHLYNFGKIIVCTVGGLIAAEAMAICGQALATDAGRVINRTRGVLAKPEPVKPGLFGRRKKVR